MGKIRRNRTKRHIEAVKPDTKEDDIRLPNFLPNQSNLPALFPVDNLFKPTNETANNNSVAITNEPPKDEEAKLNSKKDKRKIRHEKFLNKLHASKVVKDDFAKTKKRQQTVITGDLNPLTLALLDIENLSSSKKTKTNRLNVKKEGKKQTCSGEKKRQNTQLSDIEKFQQVLADPAFQCNPLAIIEEHVKNFIKNEINKS